MMGIGEMLSLARNLEPLVPRIQAAIAVAQKIEADPHVKDALLTAEKYLADPEVAAAIETAKEVAAVLPKS
jgi:hypothetical protein